MNTTPLGIRQHNPGNIECGSDWKGLAPKKPGDRFCRFTAPVYGLRAIAYLLIVYRREHGLRTIESLINRWAPKGENNTKAYVLSVAKRTGIPYNLPIAVDSSYALERLVPAIVHHENGRQPYSAEEINEAITMALADAPAEKRPARIRLPVDGGQGDVP